MPNYRVPMPDVPYDPYRAVQEYEASGAPAYIERADPDAAPADQTALTQANERATRDVVVPPETADVDQAAIPVRVVETPGTQNYIRSFAAIQYKLSTSPFCVAPRDDTRTKVRLRAMGTAYLGQDSTVSSYTGFKLPPSDDILELDITEDMWAVSDNSGATLYIIQEFMVAV